MRGDADIFIIRKVTAEIEIFKSKVMNRPLGVLTTLLNRHLAVWMSAVWVVTLPVSSETNSTCKLTVFCVEPHVIPALKRMRIIPC
jgi:hypothetical protein